MKMSALAATKQKSPNEKRGILKKIGKKIGASPPRTKRRARFATIVQIRQTSDGGDRNQSGVKGTVRFSEGELGPEGACKTPEEMEASSKQRDIDYVFVYVVHMLSQPEPLSSVGSNIIKYREQRAREESGRNRIAYTPNEEDIYDKCVEILSELETKSRLDVKAGTATLTLGDGSKEEGVMSKSWVIKLKEYLKPNARAVAAAASGERREEKRGLVDKTTLIF